MESWQNAGGSRLGAGIITSAFPGVKSVLDAEFELTSEARRPIPGDSKRLLKGDSGGAQCAFVEKTANQGDPMGYAAWRRKGGQGMVGIGGPVAARLADFDEPGSKRERWMSSEIGDDQHFVAQGGHKQQIDFREHALHFLSDLATQAIRLNEVDCG